MTDFEYRSARRMLEPIAEHFLIAPLIGENRIRFDLLDDGAFNMLSTGERALVDLARSFWNGGPTSMTFGAALRRLDTQGHIALTDALTIWIKGVS